MDLAFVLLSVLIGTGTIVYAGLRQPSRKPEPDTTTESPDTETTGAATSDS